MIRDQIISHTINRELLPFRLVTKDDRANKENIFRSSFVSFYFRVLFVVSKLTNDRNFYKPKLCIQTPNNERNDNKRHFVCKTNVYNSSKRINRHCSFVKINQYLVHIEWIV